MSKQLLAALCLAAVMVAALPGTNAWYKPPPKPYYKKTRSHKVSGYNKNLGANLGKMTNIDVNKNSAGSSQHGSVGGLNIGTNLQGNTQTVYANPEVYQHNSIHNNPHVVSYNDNNNNKYKTERKYSGDYRIYKDIKCPYHGCPTGEA